MRLGALVASLAPISWRAPHIPIHIFRAVFVARDWGDLLVMRVGRDRRVVTRDVYALAALDAAMGVA